MQIKNQYITIDTIEGIYAVTWRGVLFVVGCFLIFYTVLGVIKGIITATEMIRKCLSEGQDLEKVIEKEKEDYRKQKEERSRNMKGKLYYLTHPGLWFIGRK